VCRLASERKELAELGAKLGKKALAEMATMAQSDTILAWSRPCAGVCRLSGEMALRIL